MDVIQTTLRIPRILHKKIKEDADMNGMTRNGLILKILREWAEKIDKKSN